MCYLQALTVNKTFGNALYELDSENYRKPMRQNISQDSQNYYPLFCMVDLWSLKSPAMLDLLFGFSDSKLWRKCATTDGSQEPAYKNKWEENTLVWIFISTNKWRLWTKEELASNYFCLFHPFIWITLDWTIWWLLNGKKSNCAKEVKTYGSESSLSMRYFRLSMCQECDQEQHWA